MRDNIASGQSYLPTLLVDANGTAATQFADQLSRSGFSADITTNWPTAHAAARSRHYGSLVLVADPSRPVDLECLARLRGDITSHMDHRGQLDNAAHGAARDPALRRGLAAHCSVFDGGANLPTVGVFAVFTTALTSILWPISIVRSP